MSTTSTQQPVSTVDASKREHPKRNGQPSPSSNAYSTSVKNPRSEPGHSPYPVRQFQLGRSVGKASIYRQLPTFITVIISTEKPHSRKPYVDYYDDDMLSLCRRSDLIAKRNKDRVHGMNHPEFRPLCDHTSQRKYIISKAKHWPIFHWRLGALRYTLKHNNPRDTSNIIMERKSAHLLTILAEPLRETDVDKGISYVHALDTLATYDSKAPETRLTNWSKFQRLYEKAMKLTWGGGNLTELKNELKDLEQKLWIEVGDVSRFSAAPVDPVEEYNRGKNEW